MASFPLELCLHYTIISLPARPWEISQSIITWKAVTLGREQCPFQFPDNLFWEWRRMTTVGSVGKSEVHLALPRPLLSSESLFALAFVSVVCFPQYIFSKGRFQFEGWRIDCICMRTFFPDCQLLLLFMYFGIFLVFIINGIHY